MIRMLIAGYCFGIRSERRLCEEVHLNLAYRWFCRLGLDGPFHLLQKPAAGSGRATSFKLFDHVRALHGCGAGRRRFAVDGSLIQADADRRKGPSGEEGLPLTRRAGR